jgi:hypothetical protein
MKLYKCFWPKCSNESGKAEPVVLFGLIGALSILCVMAGNDCYWTPAYEAKRAVCHDDSHCANDAVEDGTSCSYTKYDQLLTCDCDAHRCENSRTIDHSNVGATPYSGGQCQNGSCNDATPGQKTNTASGPEKIQYTCGT